MTQKHTCDKLKKYNSTKELEEDLRIVLQQDYGIQPTTLDLKKISSSLTDFLTSISL